MHGGLKKKKFVRALYICVNEMGRSCAVPGCKSNYKNVKNNSIFKVPDEAGMLKRWEAVIPGELKLKSSHFICKKHFDDKFIIKKYVKRDANGKIIAEVPFKHPRLDSCAIPTIFGDYDMQQSLAVASLESTENPTVYSDRHLATSTLDEVLLKRQRLDSATKVSSIDIALDQQRCLEAPSVPFEATESQPKYDRCFDFPSVIINERTNQQVDNVEDQKTCSAAVPKSWSVSQLSEVSGRRLLFSYAKIITKNGVDSPIIQKCVTLYSDKTLRYHVYGHLVNSEKAKLVEILDKTEALPDILNKFERMNVCSGIGVVNVHHLQIDNVFQNYLQQWQHKDCSLISERKRCDNCLKLRKVQLQKETRLKKCKTLHRIFSSSNSVEKNKLTMRRRNNCERRTALKHEWHCYCNHCRIKKWNYQGLKF